MEISVPSKPTHFNEPWPAGVTESFSHVPGCHSWPRVAEAASSQRHHPAFSHKCMKSTCRVHFPSCSREKLGLHQRAGNMTFQPKFKCAGGTPSEPGNGGGGDGGGGKRQEPKSKHNQPGNLTMTFSSVRPF